MKRRAGCIILVSIAVLLVFLLVVPMLIPVPPLEGLRSPQELADPDSQFIEIDNVSIHSKTLGEGEPVFVLLHGFGSSLYTWRAVQEQLSQYGKVISYDRPAFGLTERPLVWQGLNPYGREAQVEYLIDLMDHYEVQKAILVGNSAGGTVAMQAALAHPERVEALILVDPAVYTGGGAPDWIKPLLGTPQMRRLGPLLARQIQSNGTRLIELAWHDPTLITQETLELYKKPLQVENWDRALWEFTLASGPTGLPGRLKELAIPALVVTGDDDRIVPTEDSIRLARKLPNARLAVIEDAGHVPHEERPEAFMQAVEEFLSSLPR